MSTATVQPKLFFVVILWSSLSILNLLFMRNCARLPDDGLRNTTPTSA